MRLVGGQTLVDHSNTDVGDERLQAARVFTRALGGNSFPTAQMPGQADDDFNGIVLADDASESG